jgi:hypothetical protein
MVVCKNCATPNTVGVLPNVTLQRRQQPATSNHQRTTTTASNKLSFSTAFDLMGHLNPEKGGWSELQMRLGCPHVKITLRTSFAKFFDTTHQICIQWELQKCGFGAHPKF